MSDLIAHRGPDDAGIWAHERGHVGFAHRRLAIIDPTPAGHQPMRDDAGRWITYNGEIYNYPELRARARRRRFRDRLRHRGRAARPRPLGRRTRSTACAACSPTRSGTSAEQELFCARDRFGIKPFYYAAGRRRPLLRLRGQGAAAVPAGDRDRPRGPQGLPRVPVLPRRQDAVQGRPRAAARPPAARCATARVATERYWEVYYDLDFDHTAKYFEERIEALLHESVRLHLRSDVPVAAYLSGGLDSSPSPSLASRTPAGR